MQHVIPKSTFIDTLKELKIEDQFEDCAQIVVFSTRGAEGGSPHEYTLGSTNNSAIFQNKEFYILKVNTVKKRDQIITLIHNNVLPSLEECWICEEQSIFFMKLPPVLSLERYLNKYKNQTDVDHEEIERFARVIINLFYKFNSFYHITGEELIVENLHLFGVDLGREQVFLRFNYTSKKSSKIDFKSLYTKINKIIGGSKILSSITKFIYNNYNIVAEQVVEKEQIQVVDVPPIGLSQGPPIGLSQGPPIGLSQGPPIGLSQGPPIGLSQGPPIGLSQGPPIGLSQGPPIGLSQGPPIGLSQGPPIITSKIEKEKPIQSGRRPSLIEQIAAGTTLRGSVCSSEQPCLKPDSVCDISDLRCKNDKNKDMEEMKDVDDITRRFENDPELMELTFILDGRKYWINRENLGSLHTFFTVKKKPNHEKKNVNLLDAIKARRHAISDIEEDNKDWE